MRTIGSRAAAGLLSHAARFCAASAAPRPSPRLGGVGERAGAAARRWSERRRRPKPARRRSHSCRLGRRGGEAQWRARPPAIRRERGFGAVGRERRPPNLAAASGAETFEWPASTRVSYVTGNYRGEVSGSAKLQWIRIADRYQVNLDLVIGPDFAPIITRRMTSEGSLAAERPGARPLRYEDNHLFRDNRRMTVVFEPTPSSSPTGSGASRLLRAGHGEPVRAATSLSGSRSGKSLPLSAACVTMSSSARPSAARFGVVEAFHLKPGRCQPQERRPHRRAVDRARLALPSVCIPSTMAALRRPRIASCSMRMRTGR